MELFREYSVSDKELIASAKCIIARFYTSNVNMCQCNELHIKELKECVEAVDKLNKTILGCNNVDKLYIYYQSKILKLNRVYGLLEKSEQERSEGFVNHAPVRFPNAEIARKKIFLS